MCVCVFTVGPASVLNTLNSPQTIVSSIILMPANVLFNCDK